MPIRKTEKYEETQVYRVRHSASHVMAQAVMELFPGHAKFAIGPAIEDGFYYDFDLPRALTPDDLVKVEARMREIIRGNHPFIRKELSAAEAKKLFADQPYKIELVEGLERGAEDEDGNPLTAPPVISTYTSDAFTDLCRGPHVESTGKINPDAVKLLNVSGAYWRGDEKRPMLQRIYGTAWNTAQELEEYLWKVEEAKKRDHRKLGKDLDLFQINPEVGPGLVLWHPKGAMIRHLVEEFCKNEHLKNGYDFVYSPHVGRGQLWETSGHLGFYRENMYAPMEMDQEDYYVKPMNCPFHIHVYKAGIRSYRELPIRYAEWGSVYRFEKAGVLHGLMRVRGFTQDDAHIFCRPDQMPQEIDRTLSFCLHILRSFGFTEFHAYLATRPKEKAVGEPAQWDAAIEALRAALDRSGLEYAIDEGGGAFYGPKIDLKIQDALGREWQCSTIQFDFNESERFDLHYVDEDGKEKRPYMIHRALLGSIERFFGVMLEHYGGALPVWLSPVQAMLIPIADRHTDYARKVQEQLLAAGIRVKVDVRTERMNAKIRDAQMQKIPYMLVMGDKEAAAGAVAVRLRSGEDKGAMPVETFLEMVKQALESKE
ncbi:MAG: threonine--tRNA ligase [Anaerolineales bacterium]|nr:threonine--tRNA ligase [Anaerolineales bacterium]